MTATDKAGFAPIYDSLVAEQGDVPAETRAAAEEIQREAAEALNWSAVRGGDWRGPAPRPRVHAYRLSGRPSSARKAARRPSPSISC